MWNQRLMDKNNNDYQLKYIIETITESAYTGGVQYYSYMYFMVYKTLAGKVVVSIDMASSRSHLIPIEENSSLGISIVGEVDNEVYNLTSQQRLKERILECKSEGVKVYSNNYKLYHNEPLTYEQIITLLNDCIQLNLSASNFRDTYLNTTLVDAISDRRQDRYSYIDILTTDMYNKKDSFGEYDICLPTSLEWELLNTETRKQIINNIKVTLTKDWVYNELFNRRNFIETPNLFQYKNKGISEELLDELGIDFIEDVVKRLTKITSRSFLMDISESISRDCIKFNIVDYYISHCELNTERIDFILDKLLQSKNINLDPIIKDRLLYKLTNQVSYSKKFIKTGMRGVTYLISMFGKEFDKLIPILRQYKYNELPLFLKSNTNPKIIDAINQVIEEKRKGLNKSPEATGLENNIIYLMGKNDIVSAYSLVLNYINASNDEQFENIKGTVKTFIEEFLLADNDNMKTINTSDLRIRFEIINNQRREWFLTEFFTTMFNSPECIRLVNRYLTGYVEKSSIEKQAYILKQEEYFTVRNYIGWSVNNLDSLDHTAGIFDRLDVLKKYINEIQPDNMWDILTYLMELELIVL